MTCKCKWDGNLDGKFLRCHTHSKEYLAERSRRKQTAHDVAYLLRQLDAQIVGDLKARQSLCAQSDRYKAERDELLKKLSEESSNA
jgi:hypothetical protein